jgi:hypothetical protein
MAKLGLFASITAIVGAISFASLRQPEAADACQHKEFKTVMVKEACVKGQKDAKDAMKAFMKEAKIKSCNQCHSSLAPKYDLKKDAYEQFQKAGGKMIDDKAAGGAKAPTPAPAPAK